MKVDDYRKTLQAHSGPLMGAIDWRALPNGNVDVTNDTSDLYRFFDCTAAAEFLYECVKRTVEEDLPREIEYLTAHDTAMRAIMNAIEMPDQLAASLIRFIRQNHGKLGRKRRDGEFAKLTDDEVELAEGIVKEAFEGSVNLGRGLDGRNRAANCAPTLSRVWPARPRPSRAGAGRRRISPPSPGSCGR